MKKVVISVVLIALLVLGCFTGEVTTPEETRPEPTTPVNALKLVEISFNQANVDLLKAMLSEDFVFHFDPRDVGQSPPGSSQYIIPETWSYTEFWQTAKKMFTEAHSISLTIPTNSVGEPDPNETVYEVKNIRITLLVMVDEVSGYLADSGYCNFEFERYEGKEGKKLWRINKWWDNTGWTSLGRILASFR